MSWRKYLRTNLAASCEHPTGNGTRAFTDDFYSNETPDITLLLELIGGRDAVVDACLPPQLAQDLRRNNVNAVWVPAILGDGASDDEIIRQLLSEHQSSWGDSNNQKVLLTRDVEFYQRIRKRAILISYHMLNSPPSGLNSEIRLRKELRKMVRSGKNGTKDLSYLEN
ncbi:MAG: hypothetical protein OK439_00525 [Thaumarchaeota archaeon]|nr:hypothetical protein [Nitrososphaerota archaeon]